MGLTRDYVVQRRRPTMRSTLLNGDPGNRTFAVIMETGDEAMSCLQTFVE